MCVYNNNNYTIRDHDIERESKYAGVVVGEIWSQINGVNTVVSYEILKK